MTDLLSLKEAVDIYQNQYSQVDKLWSYFGTVTLAVLGFTIGSEKATKSINEVAAIISGYLVFCYGNFEALSLGQKQLLQFADIAIIIGWHYGVCLRSLTPLSSLYIARFYWCVVGSVCLGVLFIAWKRQHSDQSYVPSRQ